MSDHTGERDYDPGTRNFGAAAVLGAMVLGLLWFCF